MASLSVRQRGGERWRTQPCSPPLYAITAVEFDEPLSLNEFATACRRRGSARQCQPKARAIRWRMTVIIARCRVARVQIELRRC